MMEKTAKKRPAFAGQIKHKSVKEALQSISDILGKLHIETVEKGRRR